MIGIAIFNYGWDLNRNTGTPISSKADVLLLVLFQNEGR